MKRTMTESHNCEKELTAKNGDLTSGYWQDDDTLECSCGVVWVHLCDEAEGCCWIPNEDDHNAE